MVVAVAPGTPIFNRKTGAFKETHAKRKAWWQRKAREVGVDPTSSQWIARGEADPSDEGEAPQNLRPGALHPLRLPERQALPPPGGPALHPGGVQARPP